VAGRPFLGEDALAQRGPRRARGALVLRAAARCQQRPEVLHDRVRSAEEAGSLFRLAPECGDRRPPREAAADAPQGPLLPPRSGPLPIPGRCSWIVPLSAGKIAQGAQREAAAPRVTGRAVLPEPLLQEVRRLRVVPLLVGHDPEIDDGVRDEPVVADL